MACVFCRIIDGEIPSSFLYRDEKMIIIKDLEPKAELHYLAIPTRHFARFEQMTEDDESVVSYMFRKIASLQHVLGIADGYRLVVNQGEYAGQTVQHLHVHILGGQPLDFADLRTTK